MALATAVAILATAVERQRATPTIPAEGMLVGTTVVATVEVGTLVAMGQVMGVRTLVATGEVMEVVMVAATAGATDMVTGVVMAVAMVAAMAVGTAVAMVARMGIPFTEGTPAATRGDMAATLVTEGRGTLLAIPTTEEVRTGREVAILRTVGTPDTLIQEASALIPTGAVIPGTVTQLATLTVITGEIITANLTTDRGAGTRAPVRLPTIDILIVITLITTMDTTTRIRIEVGTLAVTILVRTTRATQFQVTRARNKKWDR